jgi:hypothetical protein
MSGLSRPSLRRARCVPHRDRREKPGDDSVGCALPLSVCWMPKPAACRHCATRGRRNTPDSMDVRHACTAADLIQVRRLDRAPLNHHGASHARSASSRARVSVVLAWGLPCADPRPRTRGRRDQLFHGTWRARNTLHLACRACPAAGLRAHADGQHAAGNPADHPGRGRRILADGARRGWSRLLGRRRNRFAARRDADPPRLSTRRATNGGPETDISEKPRTRPNL